jgi:hypothetical protein
MTKWSKWKKGWVEQEFVLLIIAASPSETGLPNEQISYRIVVTLHAFKLQTLFIACIFNTHIWVVSTAPGAVFKTLYFLIK